MCSGPFPCPTHTLEKQEMCDVHTNTDTYFSVSKHVNGIVNMNMLQSVRM